MQSVSWKIRTALLCGLCALWVGAHFYLVSDQVFLPKYSGNKAQVLRLGNEMAPLDQLESFSVALKFRALNSHKIKIIHAGNHAQGFQLRMHSATTLELKIKGDQLPPKSIILARNIRVKKWYQLHLQYQRGSWDVQLDEKPIVWNPPLGQIPVWFDSIQFGIDQIVNNNISLKINDISFQYQIRPAWAEQLKILLAILFILAAIELCYQIVPGKGYGKLVHIRIFTFSLAKKAVSFTFLSMA